MSTHTLTRIKYCMQLHVVYYVFVVHTHKMDTMTEWESSSSRWRRRSTTTQKHRRIHKTYIEEENRYTEKCIGSCSVVESPEKREEKKTVFFDCSNMTSDGRRDRLRHTMFGLYLCVGWCVGVQASEWTRIDMWKGENNINWIIPTTTAMRRGRRQLQCLQLIYGLAVEHKHTNSEVYTLCTTLAHAVAFENKRMHRLCVLLFNSYAAFLLLRFR